MSRNLARLSCRAVHKHIQCKEDNKLEDKDRILTYVRYLRFNRKFISILYAKSIFAKACALLYGISSSSSDSSTYCSAPNSLMRSQNPFEEYVYVYVCCVALSLRNMMQLHCFSECMKSCGPIDNFEMAKFQFGFNSLFICLCFDLYLYNKWIGVLIYVQFSCIIASVINAQM